ncbi:MAG: hypothetical protein R6U52_09125 [Kosmotogaceae bacterium]
MGSTSFRPVNINDISHVVFSDTLVLIHEPFTLKENVKKLKRSLTRKEFEDMKSNNTEFFRMVDTLDESDNPIIGLYPLKK